MDKHQHLKQSFRNEEELPKHLSWDAMGPGILSEVLETKPKRRFLWIPLIVGALLLLFGSYFYLGSDTKLPENSSTDKLQESQDNFKSIDTHSTASISKVHEESILLKTEEATASLSLVKVQEVNNLRVGNTGGQLQNKVTKDKRQSISNSPIRQVNNTNKKSSLNSSTDSNNRLGKNTLDTNSSSPLGPTKLTGNAITLKYLQPIVANLKTPTYDLGVKTKEEITEQRKPLTSTLGVEVFSLTNYWFEHRSKSVLDTHRKSTEQAIPSISVGGRVHYTINDNWRLSTGISYQRLESKFYFYGKRPATLNPTVDVITTNLFTGAVLQTHSIIRSQAASISREVLHYNQYESFAIPLTISKVWNNQRRLSFTSGLGLAYAFFRSNSGKTLYHSPLGYTDDNLDVSTFEQENIYHDKSIFSMEANVAMRYQLSTHMSVGLEVGSSYSLTNYNASSESLKPLVLQSGVNLGYWF